MKVSHLALRPEPAEDQPAPPVEWVEIAQPAAPAHLRVPARPRRSLIFRSRTIREPATRLFRVL